MTQTEMSLTVFDPVKEINADILAKDAAQEFDHTTAEGEKGLRSWVHRVRGHKGDIERCRIATKDGAAKFIKQVNEVARELTAEVQVVIDTRMKPLDEIEEKKRAAAEAAVEAERKEAERVETERLVDLKKREDEVAEKEAEFKAIEAAAKKKIEEADRIIREKKIADEAAENAKKQAKIDADAALAKAESDKRAAIQAEKDKAAKVESDRLAEEKRKEQLAEVQRKEIERKQKNKKHQEFVHQEIINALHPLAGCPLAEGILTKIKVGQVPYLSINY